MRMRTRHCLGLGVTLVVAVLLWSSVASAATRSGTPWSWGYNAYGQLGDGTSELSSVPIQVGGVDDITAISGGLAHTLALKSDGTLWSWGNNNVGQVGNGAASDLPSGATEVVGIDHVIAIGTGVEHSSALKTDGTVWAWGGNHYGQLGTGGTDDSALPVQVGGLDRITNIAAGGYRNLARRSDGTFWGWGTPGLGGAGFSSEAVKLSPVQMDGPAGVVDLAVGIDHSMVVKDGAVYSWGLNRYGQLGDGSWDDHPGELVPVKGLKDIVAVAAGSYHSLALTKSGALLAWGWNGSGQLGNGTTTDSNVPIQVKGVSGVVAMAAGWYHCIAVTQDGSVWVWGDNLFGKLGDGSFKQSAIPRKLVGFGGISAVGAGADYSLAVRVPPTPTPTAASPSAKTVTKRGP
jgi:alpha-tubulin suppressor-like RCC1 family protein